jgi:hypothetical protein
MAYIFESVCTDGVHIWEFVYILWTFPICRASPEWGGSGFGLDVMEGDVTMREQFASIQSSRLSTRCTHSSTLEWFLLLWCSFLEILGGSLFRLGSKRGLLAQGVARCSFLVVPALRLYFLRLHHMTYIKSWAMKFWSWEVLIKAELNCWNRAAFVIVVICNICKWDDCYLRWILILSRSIQSSIRCLSMTIEPCGSLSSLWESLEYEWMAYEEHVQRCYSGSGTWELGLEVVCVN